MLRIPHCLDNRLTDGAKVVSPMHPAHFTPQKNYVYVSGTHMLEAEQTSGPSADLSRTRVAESPINSNKPRTRNIASIF
jgi:hypothetical protein